MRTIGDENEPRRFSTRAAKAVALIGHLPDTLADRSLVVPMRRRAAGEHVERLRVDRPDGIEDLRRRAARWAADRLGELRCAPRGALSPELVRSLRRLKPALLQLVAPEAARTVGETLGGVSEVGASLLTAEVCAMRLEQFAQGGLVVEVWSAVLDEAVVFASDDARVDPGVLRTVYRAHETAGAARAYDAAGAAAGSGGQEDVPRVDHGCFARIGHRLELSESAPDAVGTEVPETQSLSYECARYPLVPGGVDGRARTRHRASTSPPVAPRPGSNILGAVTGSGDTMELPLNEPRKVPLDDLLFDRENPRFAPTHDLDKTSDVAIILALARVADLGELLQSIATSGYVDIEPLVVLEATQDHEKWMVLEGNRRLAALRLLTDPELAREVGIEIPAISPEVKDSFGQVTAYRVADRDEARDFIGFKHINGPHRWDSLAKARFAARWYEHERGHGITLRDIARRMGDRHDTILRMVAGLYVLQQAESHGLFRFDDVYPGRPFAFSHLYTALTRPGYRDFLGLPDDWRRVDPEPDPISSLFFPQLRHVLLWLYGSKQDSIRPVVASQNPNVRELGEVLGNPKARAIMAAQQDLRAAYAEVDTPDLQFERSLVEAHRHLEKALSKVDAFVGGDMTMVQLASEVSSKASILLAVMNSKSK